MAFTFGYAPQTPEGINRRRQIAQALLMHGMDTSPIQSPWQGAARIAQALVGGYQGQQAEQAALKLQQEQEAKTKAAQAAAAAKAQQEAQQPVYKYEGGQWWNVNPNLPSPLAVSQATQKKDELTAWQKYLMERNARQDERQQRVDDWRMKKETADAEAEPAFKENQVRVGEFARRIALGNDEIDAAMKAGADPTRTWLGGNLTSDDSRWNSKEWKQYKQAKDAIILAILRKDTGASITDREYDETDRTYFPQPGDTPEIVEQKARARKQLQADLAASSGGAFDYMEKKNPRPKGINTLDELNTQLQEGQTATDTQTGKRYTKRNGQIVEVPR